MFILDEIDVGGPKLVYDHIQVRKVREKVTKDQPRVLEDGPSMEQKVARPALTTEAIDGH